MNKVLYYYYYYYYKLLPVFADTYHHHQGLYSLLTEEPLPGSIPQMSVFVAMDLWINYYYYYYCYYYINLNLLLIRKLTTKSGLFTIKFCLKKTIQYKYYLQFISIKKTHIVPIKKFISIKNRYSNTNTNTNF